MAYVEVEVDLDMFSTDDILIELEYRKDEMTSKMMERLNRLNNNYSSGNKLSLNDQMKTEYIKRIFDKYSLDEIEKALPEYR